MAKSKTWLVSTDGKRALRSIAKDLAAAGLTDAKVLAEVNCITGAATDKAAAAMRKVKGVVDVAPDFPVDIGPPDKPQTW
ncbi:MAG: hypothetical protein FJX57_00990 [Alphaproteobacteria bacterium]|nr:hypothetical protein [Alphaproteobacteria bacterium]